MKLPKALGQGIFPLKSPLTSEIFAGLTLAALAIPEVMGYTKISQTPVITGLYTMLVPMVLFAFLGSSRHLVVSADSATAAILAAGLVGMALPKSNEWMALAEVLALLSAGFLLIARVARLGFLADFLSRTVLVGFLSGVGVQVALGEIPSLLGWENLASLPQAFVRIVTHPEQISWATLALSVGVVGLIVGLRRVSRQIPGPLLAVVLSLLAVPVFHLDRFGVSVLGAIPHGLPQLGLPQVAWSWTLIQKLLPTAFAMFIVILAQSAVTSRAYAERAQESFDENVDLVGLAAANVGAALSGSFVVNGSPTKTQMVDSAGGKTQAAQLSAVAVVVLVLLFLTGPLAFLPKATLAAVVFLIGYELIDWKGLRRIGKERPVEFAVAIVTALTVIFVGVEQSILLAIGLSLISHTRHGYLVTNVVLLDGPQGWRQKPAKPGLFAEPGLVIYRFLHNMYYANAHTLKKDVLTLAQDTVSWFCVDMAAVNDVDFTASETLRTLHQDLAARGIRMVFSEMLDSVRQEFDRSELTKVFGTDAFFTTLDSVRDGYRQEQAKKLG